MSDQKTVALLLSAAGDVVSVWESESAARERADKYNADPFTAPSDPDPDAPYSVEVWVVS